MKEEGSIKVLSAVFLVLTGILLGLSIGKIFTKECPECKKCENVKEPTNVEVKNKLITYYKSDDRTIYLYGLEDFKFNDKSLKEYDSPFNEITNIIKGYTFRVTEISNKAFYGCKRMKKLIIKSKFLKKTGKKIFKNKNKKVIVKVPSGKLKVYKKMFRGKGIKVVR